MKTHQSVTSRPRKSWTRVLAMYSRAVLILVGFRYVKGRFEEFESFLRRMLVTLGNRFGMKKPPALIPRDLMDRFSMNGAVKVIYHYYDERSHKPLIYESDVIDRNIARIRSRETGAYGDIDLWIYEALEKFPITGKSVAIIGSTDQGYGPWYECVCLAYGGYPTTVEYNDVHFEDARVASMHPSDLEASGQTFDAVFSFFSFQQDGLGRYGDPLNPEADLEAMAAWKRYLKPNGLMYLTVPIGVDKVWFNVHRIYGRARFPKLIEQWETVETIGFEEKFLDRDTNYGWNPKNDDATLLHPATLMHPNYREYGPVNILRNSQGRR